MLVCRNSTDPACGPFRWDPAPVDRPATLKIVPQSSPIVAGRQVSLLLTVSDPDGAASLDCFSVSLNRPGLSSGACSVVNPDTCPARYGPWNPPAAKPSQATTDTIVEFDESGTYVITVSVSRADGCDNVDPYRSGVTSSITVEVQAPPPSTTTTAAP